MTTWIKDDNGNRCSVERWGSEEAAREALASNKNCKDCSDCTDCTGCSGCTHVAWLYDKKSIVAEPSAAPKSLGPPPVPVIADIHKTVYAAASNPGALRMDRWHACSNTHCRAGWVIALAGDAGRKLEEFFDTPLAAMKIYAASDPGFRINPCRFFDENKAALTDMKKLAEGASAS